MLELEGTACCAVQEIVYLRDEPSAEEAMGSFCERIFGYEDYDYFTYRSTRKMDQSIKPHGHYIFTAVIGYKGRDRRNGKPSYGPNFANFIRRHRLGTVRAGKPEYNRTNHPTHLVQVWVWQPNPTTLARWYKRYLKKVEKEENG